MIAAGLDSAAQTAEIPRASGIFKLNAHPAEGEAIYTEDLDFSDELLVDFLSVSAGKEVLAMESFSDPEVLSFESELDAVMEIADAAAAVPDVMDDRFASEIELLRVPQTKGRRKKVAVAQAQKDAGYLKRRAKNTAAASLNRKMEKAKKLARQGKHADLVSRNAALRAEVAGLEVVLAALQAHKAAAEHNPFDEILAGLADSEFSLVPPALAL
jgi:hypothetical protein